MTIVDLKGGRSFGGYRWSIVVNKRGRRLRDKSQLNIAFQCQILFVNLLIHHKLDMTNPFEFFNASDDDEDNKVTVVKKDDKPKLTHADKRAYKKQKEESEKRAADIVRSAPASEALPSKVKETSHKYPHMEREKKQWKQKDVPSGHALDRQSGTGREDRPRKAGGGYNNVGNAKDMLNQDKYGEGKTAEEKPVEEQAEVVEEKEPEEEKITLEEYYKSKGVELAYQKEGKAPVKKEDIKADWIKKEKLTLLTTKEDLKNEDKKAQQTVKHNTAKTSQGIEEENLGKVGFGSKPAAKDAPKQDDKGGKRGGKKAPKFSNEDFPSL